MNEGFRIRLTSTGEAPRNVSILEEYDLKRYWKDANEVMAIQQPQPSGDSRDNWGWKKIVKIHYLFFLCYQLEYIISWYRSSYTYLVVENNCWQNFQLDHIDYVSNNSDKLIIGFNPLYLLIECGYAGIHSKNRHHKGIDLFIYL